MTKQGSPIIFVDADNTLWDTNQVFADAQLALLASVETAVGSKAAEDDRLTFVRTFDQAIAEKHSDHVRYPPYLLATSLALALTRSKSVDILALALSGRVENNPLLNSDLERIEKEFRSAIKARPVLRPGVSSGLTQLVESARRVVVLTEGNQETVVQNAEHHGLRDFFEDIIFTRKKDAEFFKQTLLSCCTPGLAFMVGDQLDRDISPAKDAGLITIHFPGGFEPKWAQAGKIAVPDYKISDFSEVPEIIEQTISRLG